MSVFRKLLGNHGGKVEGGGVIHARSSATFLPTVNPHYYVESQDIYFLGNEHKNKVKWIA